MSGHAGSICPRCSAPLPAPLEGVVVQCPYCHGQASLGVAQRLRQLLLVDATAPAEAASLVAQHLRERFLAPTAVQGGGELRLAPVWSVLRADGDLLTGPATTAEPLLARLQLPSLPARPLVDGEELPGTALPLDVDLETFLRNARGSDGRGSDGRVAGARGDSSPARVWLAWIPYRAWQVRVGRGLYRALTVGDAAVPLLEPVTPANARPLLAWGGLVPLLGYATAVAALALLLPLVFYLPAAAVALGLALWAIPTPSTAVAGAAPTDNNGGRRTDAARGDRGPS